MGQFSIGEVAHRTGVKVPTIRYYEQIGLLPQPPRTASNRRLYTEDDLARLGFIRHARELGFEVDAIRALFQLQGSPGQSCSAVDTIAKTRLVEVEQRIASLLALKSELERMILSCKRGRVAECRIIEVLQDHALCAHHNSA